jgi:CubicO group peptidase (beta-lactamase class C family)
MCKAALAPLLAFLFVIDVAAAQEVFPGAEWDRVEPDKSGWSAAKLSEARDWSKQINVTAFMAVHRGGVVAEWGDTTKRTELASVRKSLLNALFGIAIADRKISLDSTLADLKIDDNAPSLTDIEKQATVRMLLQARSGVYHAALYETAAMAARRPPRGSHPPGTFWYYNNWDFNALGTIYEQAVGAGIYDSLDLHIARPIGMQDYRPQDGSYFTGQASIHRAYPIRMSARDLARFALLYLRNGNWRGRQIVPSAWVHESTQPYSESTASGIRVGYGYLWWTSPPGASQGTFANGAYTAIGAGGQYAFVFPRHDLAVVIRVDRDQRLPEPKFGDAVLLARMAIEAGGLERSAR